MNSSKGVTILRRVGEHITNNESHQTLKSIAGFLKNLFVLNLKTEKVKQMLRKHSELHENIDRGSLRKQIKTLRQFH